jgi:hypothetical protein
MTTRRWLGYCNPITPPCTHQQSPTVKPRYPNELGITNEDMKTAIQYAKDVQEFVLNIIG